MAGPLFLREGKSIFGGGVDGLPHQCIGHWFAMTGFLQGVRCKAGRVVREADPYNAIHR